jgi:hypothetical protein
MCQFGVLAIVASFLASVLVFWERNEEGEFAAKELCLKLMDLRGCFLARQTRK